MSPNAIAVTSIIVSGATAVSAVVVTGIGGWRDRAHRTKMAETERKQARLADAYVSVLEYTDRVGYWAQNVRLADDTDPPRRRPRRPDFETHSAVMAKVDAYGSAEVKRMVEVWSRVVDNVRLYDQIVGMRQEHERRYPAYRPKDPVAATEWRDWLAALEELDEKYRPAEASARQALKDQVAAELR